MLHRLMTSTAVTSGIVALALATTAPSHAETFKVSHWVPPQHPFAKSLADWAKSIGEDSGGDIKISVFPAGQLGPASDHYDMAKNGIADATWVNPGFSPGRWPITSLAEMPLTISDPMGGSVALTKWYRKYAAKEMPDIHYCFTHTLESNTLFSINKPIRVPADFKGQRVRPSGEMQARMIKANGGTTVLMPYPKVREPLERGVIDATLGSPHGLIIFGGAKKIQHIMRAPLSNANWVIPINKKKYDGMSATNRRIIDNRCNTAEAVKMARPATMFERAGWAKLEKLGKKIFTLTDAEKAAWRKASAPLLAAWKADVNKRGHNADQIHSEFIAALKAENALEQ